MNTGDGGKKSSKVTATDSACKLASTTASTGSITFSVTNKGSTVTEVENISPGLTRDMTVQVSNPGRYITASKPGMEGNGIRAAFTVTSGK